MAATAVTVGATVEVVTINPAAYKGKRGTVTATTPPPSRSTPSRPRNCAGPGAGGSTFWTA
ncbi:hypothetical protein [Actinacidiphila oryziradicis]|uniref:Uncharacterized protein n=1 Tax=Actinacidiphila oryziradicis TaxID=2571141 RepID=A0A4U0RLZ9_9ACTN|nr:hypothetical protein [Actinacidiphila oryziradicis]TJZ96841.1 hypothetical protein FCI23_50410 [Actinacidiphila oryziradicis]